MASSSACFIEASSDRSVLPDASFLSFAYHDKSFPFCHLPTGALRECPTNQYLLL